MIKVLRLRIVSGVTSPTRQPFSTRQYFGSPSQPSRDLPSKMGTKPASSATMVSLGCVGGAGVRAGRVAGAADGCACAIPEAKPEMKIATIDANRTALMDAPLI